MCKFLSFLKSVFFCFRVFPVHIAIRIPVIISHRVKVCNIRKDCIRFLSENGRLKIGFSNGSFNMGQGRLGYVDFKQTGVIVVSDYAVIPAGSRINVKGTLYLGSHFESNTGLLISCSTEIRFGDDVAIGWDVTVIDGDGHDIFRNSEIINNDAPICIGDRVWLGAKSTVLKGATIANDSVVGYGSIVSKEFTMPNVLIAGAPAKVLKENIEWRK